MLRRPCIDGSESFSSKTLACLPCAASAGGQYRLKAQQMHPLQHTGSGDHTQLRCHNIAMKHARKLSLKLLRQP